MNATDNNKKSCKGNRTLIVIGRQFGSGGRYIGKLVAEAMGIKYYDSELLAEAAKKMGYSRDIFDCHDEKRPSPLRSMLQGMLGTADNFHDVSICSERMYKEQARVIKEICRNESCVIVGRTADYIMRDHPGLLSVFLHAPEEIRAKRIIARGEAKTLKEAIEKARKFDKDRESYYNYYTGSQSWGKADNYSLSLDSSQIGAMQLAQIIKNIAEMKSVARVRETREESPGNTGRHVS